MNCQMSEGHLVWRRLKRKFIGGHGFYGRGHVLGGAGKGKTERVADGIGGSARGRRGRLCGGKCRKRCE